MSIANATSRAEVVHYPDSDGLPISDNTLQFAWIGILKWGLEACYLSDPNIFAADHRIYPVEGKVKVQQAPDVYVAFGRPKKARGSYKVWEEEGIFPQVVFEVWSPSNHYRQMDRKFKFCQRHGVEEYYIIYPEEPSAEGWKREGKKLVPIHKINGWVSPRLGLRFEQSKGSSISVAPMAASFALRPRRRPSGTPSTCEPNWNISEPNRSASGLLDWLPN